jgi:YD repeat-containing protein
VSSDGALYLVRKYYDVPAVTALVSTTIHSSDTSYGYDSYGNPTSVTTYAGAGTTTYDAAGTPSWGSRGGGSATRVTTTTYDSTFHIFRIQVTPPITALAETAGYETSITDPNGNTTAASYDSFGRLGTLWKPGDSASYPTVRATYYDTALPFRYEVEQRQTAGASGTVRHLESYYDGLGRLIQTKGESARDGSNNVTQAILVDKRYDGLGQEVQASQPFTATQSGSTFTSYTAPGTNLYNATLTSYDALGRPTQVQSPDGTHTTMTHSISGGYRTTTTVDARYHQTQHQSDMFGRLRLVKEYLDC